jgi:hypothetical protein
MELSTSVFCHLALESGGYQFFEPSGIKLCRYAWGSWARNKLHQARWLVTLRESSLLASFVSSRVEKFDSLKPSHM